MQAFFSWLTSQSGVSLLVALIALGGVLVTTWWNNKAADKRRRADQAAADQRRKDDQAAEDARRKADDDRRERERREQLQREDRARQRRAVADCVKGIFSEMRRTSTEVLESQLNETADKGAILKKRWIDLETFYWTATTYLNACDLEITEPMVADEIKNVWSAVEAEQKSLSTVENLVKTGSLADAYEAASRINPATGEIMVGLRTLTVIALLHLHDEYDLDKKLTGLIGKPPPKAL
ncbi:hypothetical protein [Corynebacterium casei]|uniref:hypothetical protein n=1 Tax=Corynebacterium casei TaxID=160386 RepID=UPI003FD1F87E